MSGYSSEDPKGGSSRPSIQNSGINLIWFPVLWLNFLFLFFFFFFFCWNMIGQLGSNVCLYFDGFLGLGSTWGSWQPAAYGSQSSCHISGLRLSKRGHCPGLHASEFYMFNTHTYTHTHTHTHTHNCNRSFWNFLEKKYFSEDIKLEIFVFLYFS